MMGEILTPEVAYAILVFEAWVWAVSQTIWFFRFRTGWRATMAVLLTATALFFTFVGSVFWLNWFDREVHATAIWTLALAYNLAFIHWLRLTPGKKGTDERPVKDD